MHRPRHEGGGAAGLRRGLAQHAGAGVRLGGREQAERHADRARQAAPGSPGPDPSTGWRYTGDSVGLGPHRATHPTGTINYGNLQLSCH